MKCYNINFPILHLLKLRELTQQYFEYEIYLQTHTDTLSINYEDDKEAIGKKYLQEIRANNIPYDLTITVENEDAANFDEMYKDYLFVFRPEISPEAFYINNGKEYKYKEISEYNHKFVPVPIDEGDETFRFLFYEWNITKLIKYLEENNFEVHTLKSNQYEKMITSLIGIDSKNVEKVTFEKPIIIGVLQNNPVETLPLDGNHRLRKAEKIKKETIDAYIVPFDIQIKFLTPRTDMFSYQTLIEKNMQK